MFKFLCRPRFEAQVHVYQLYFDIKAAQYKVGIVTRSQAVARIADRTAKNCRGHVTCPLSGKFICAPARHCPMPIQSRVSNLKSLAQVVLKICSIVCQNC